MCGNTPLGGVINRAASAKHIERSPTALLWFIYSLGPIFMENIHSILEDPALKEWLDSCPTAWNIEYSDGWNQCCFFVCPPDVPVEEYLESFRVN